MTFALTVLAVLLVGGAIAALVDYLMGGWE